MIYRTGKIMSLNARESCLSGDSAKTNDNVAYRAEAKARFSNLLRHH